mmetsp:Transcript_59417/g.143433  ORF Transcript_59417/g.143433 Transcript_59417/m.143433 type:complete len:245 (+) Transcript_59417:263-997(+)
MNWHCLEYRKSVLLIHFFHSMFCVAGTVSCSSAGTARFAGGRSPPTESRLAPRPICDFKALASSRARRVASSASFSRCLCSWRCLLACSAASVADFRICSSSSIFFLLTAMTSIMASFFCASRRFRRSRSSFSLVSWRLSLTSWCFLVASASCAIAASTSARACSNSSWAALACASCASSRAAASAILASTPAMTCFASARASSRLLSPSSSRTFLRREEALLLALAFGFTSTRAPSFAAAPSS